MISRFGRLAATLLGFTAVLLSPPAKAQTAVYTWNPTNLYNQTHPATGSNPLNYDTDWVSRPGGGQSLRITVAATKPLTNYYDFIVVSPGLLQSGQEYRAQLQFEVSTPTVNPRYFYMYTRNSAGTTYDIWRKIVDDPGTTRTVEMPLDLKTIGTGNTWYFRVGMLGPGSIIVDSFKIITGSGNTVVTAPSGGTPVSNLPAGVTSATGAASISITAPAAPTQTITVQSPTYNLAADAGAPVSQAVATTNYSELQRAINNAKTQPTKILIPPGTYRFYPTSDLLLDGVNNVTIDGQGAEFIFTRLRSGTEHFFINNSSKLAFKNLKIDYDVPTAPIANLGQVQNFTVTTNGSVKTSDFDITFPDLNATQTLQLTQSNVKWQYMHPFDSVRLVKTDAEKNAIPASTVLTFSNVSGNSMHVSLPIALKLVNGGYYCVQHLYYDMTVFKISDSNNLLFDTVTIYSNPGMGWLTSSKSHHLKLYNCAITRRAGGRNPLTTSADGFHVNESQGNIEINTCTFTGSGDDTINIHDNCWQGGIDFANSGSYSFRLLNCPKNRLRIEPGSVLEFFKPDYSPISTPNNVKLTVASVTYVGGNSGYAADTYADVTFTTAPPASISGLTIVRNLTFGNTNVRIAGCSITYTNGRAILLSADNATIESNYIRNVFSTPIQFHTEIVDNLWAEGHGASNVIVRNNTFENDNAHGRWDGAIIYAGASIPWGMPTNPLFQTLLIHNNVFYNCPGPSMFFNSSKNVIARNNDIRISQTPPGVTRYSASIKVATSSYLALGGNTWKFLAPITANPAVVYDPATTSVIEPDTNSQVNLY